MSDKLVVLLSGGIDSVIAAYLMARKGSEMILIYGFNEPYTDARNKERALKCAERLSQIFNKKIKMYTLPHGANLQDFINKCPRKLTCVLCKRMLLRIAEKIAKEEDAKAVVTGENVAQVASQTLQNLVVLNQAVKIPIIRPLIAFDKQQIIDFAKEVGTYEPSILPADGCLAVPPKPATSAKLEDVLMTEENLDIEGMLKKMMDGKEVLEISA